MKSDNKFVAVLLIILGILGLLAMFVGFYLMLQSGDSTPTLLLWLGVFIGGLLLFCIPVIVILVNKRKINK